jgi:hypothetical protein
MTALTYHLRLLSEAVKALEGMPVKAIKDAQLRKSAETTGRGLELVRPGGAKAARESRR